MLWESEIIEKKIVSEECGGEVWRSIDTYIVLINNNEMMEEIFIILLFLGNRCCVICLVWDVKMKAWVSTWLIISVKGLY